MKSYDYNCVIAVHFQIYEMLEICSVLGLQLYTITNSEFTKSNCLIFAFFIVVIKLCVMSIRVGKSGIKFNIVLLVRQIFFRHVGSTSEISVNKKVKEVKSVKVKPSGHDESSSRKWSCLGGWRTKASVLATRSH